MNFILDYMQTSPALFWAAVGVVLLIVEVLSPAGFFLSFAAAAFIVAAKTWLTGASPLTDALIFAVAGVILIVPLRKLLRRYSDRTGDINEL